MTKGIIYYTDNKIEEPIRSLVQRYLYDSGLQIISSSLEPMNFGVNVVLNGERGYPTMVRQIISALQLSTCDYVFFCEHDVLYHPSHFVFCPPREDVFYYNANAWRWFVGSNVAIRHDRMLSQSQLCVNRKFALDHYMRRNQRILDLGWDKVVSKEPEWARKMGYEPGQKKKKRGGFSDDDFETWESEYPVIDIRHRGTFSAPKTKLTDFKHPPKWFKEIPIEEIKGWDMKGLFNLC